MMLSINTSINNSLYSMYNDRLYDPTNGIDSDNNSYCGIKFLCRDWRVVEPHDPSRIRLLAMYISSSLILVHYSGSIVVTNGIHGQRSDISFTILMLILLTILT